MTIIVKVRQYYTIQTINVALSCFSEVEGRPLLLKTSYTLDTKFKWFGLDIV